MRMLGWGAVLLISLFGEIFTLKLCQDCQLPEVPAFSIIYYFGTALASSTTLFR